MGTGIGIVGSRVAGLDVCFVDPSEASLKKSQTLITKWCDKEISKERMDEKTKGDVLGRIKFADNISALSDADFVVEAATENFNLKKTIFEHLAECTPEHAILATNTSSISITKIAGVIPPRAHQVIGMHFMNPVPVMKLIEVIKAL